ncbi:hypothetical protein PG997_011834 [Apiospora hydei]|uniref:C2H2-type domain-containing protein n=1 Tax=Apiospora hydei TaxID=1337664 RepID=A0ABR1V1L7_9PEZI
MSSSSAPVSSPASSSEQSTASGKPRTNRKSKTDNAYEELELPIVDESLRLPSGKLQCPLLNKEGQPCLREMNTPRDMRKHLRDHIKPVLCPERTNKRAPCYVQKAYPRDMDRHVDTHHTSKKGVESKYKCKLCRKGFARKDHLKRHVDKAICEQ